MARGQIQDILYDMNDTEEYWEAANDFEEQIIIDENKDIVILENEEALWQAIVGVLKTPPGGCKGTTMEDYGCELLRLRGQNLNYHIVELAKVYIKKTIPQFQDKVRDFPDITITPSKYPDKWSMKIRITVDSIYGTFNRTMFI